MGEESWDEGWRLKVLDRGTLVFAVLAVVWILVFWDGLVSRLGLPFVLVPLAMVNAATWWKALGYRARAGLLVATLAVAFLLTFFHLGYAPGGFAAGLLLTCTAGVFFHVRGAVVAWVLTSVAYFAGGYLVSGGWVENPFQPVLFDPSDFRVGLRMSLSYAMLSALLAVSVAIIVERLSTSLKYSRRALEEARRANDLRVEAEAKRAAAEDAAEHSAKRSEQLNATAQIAAGVAHDFNNSLQIIVGSLCFIPADDEQTREGLANIGEACEDAARMVRDLLTLARKEQRAPRVTDLAKVVRGAQKQLRRLLPADIALEVQSSSPAISYLDEVQVRQLLANLALNARDAMPRGGELRIEVETLADEAVLRVSDNGVGMDETTRAKVFEPFFTTKGTGTGLGLAMVKRIAAQHGAAIELHSEKGRGTSFEITFALHDGEAGESIPAARSGVRGLRPLSILVVDDQAAVRKVVRGILEQEGHRVTEAASVDDALALPAETRNKVAVVCTDAIMPGTSVRVLFERMSRDFPDAGVILCSGYIEEELLRRGIEARTIPFLRKPFTRQQLLDEIARVLASKAA